MASHFLHRPVTFARRGMVVAPHYLAAEAGLELLKAGGNALDSAVAASAMLQIVYPFVCGLGGDIFMIIYDVASGKLHGLNGSGRSAQAATIERYRDLGYTTMPVLGIHTVTVPGCVSGWDEAEERFGRLGLAQALAPAISYAEEGVAVGPDLHAALTRTSVREAFIAPGTRTSCRVAQFRQLEQLSAFPHWHELYGPSRRTGPQRFTGERSRNRSPRFLLARAA